MLTYFRLSLRRQRSRKDDERGSRDEETVLFPISPRRGNADSKRENMSEDDVVVKIPVS